MLNRLTFGFALIFVVGLLTMALAPLWQPGVASGDDTLISVYRIFALHKSWQQGQLYPRFSADLAFGYGSPLFHYYPPLASFVAGGFVLLGAGYITAFKLSLSAALVVSGLSMYGLARRLRLSLLAALLAAIAYALSPYQLANLYLRGAVAEAVAVALLPWILCSFQGLLQTRESRWLALASILLAGLLITHNAQSLFFVPVLLLFCAFVMLQHKVASDHGADDTDLEEHRPRNRFSVVGWMIAAIGLALALSLFFWLPALLDRGYVNISALSAGFYNPLTHLVAWGDLVQQTLFFDYERSIAFKVGWLPLLLAWVGLVAGLRARQQRGLSLFAATLVVVSLVLQAQQSAAFWQMVPLVSFIQFPWRLLSFVYLGIAILIGLLANAIQSSNANRIIRIGGSVLLALALTGYALSGLGTMVGSERARGVFNESDVGYRDLYERGKLGFELFSDYQPVTVKTAMIDIPNTPAQPYNAPAMAAVPAIQLREFRGTTFSAAIDSDAPFQLILNRFDFPGWQTRIDSQIVAHDAVGELGLIRVDIPRGNHQIEIGFQASEFEFWSRLAFGLWLAVFGMRFLTHHQVYWLWRIVWVSCLVAIVSLPMWIAVIMPKPLIAPAQAKIGEIAQLVGYSTDQKIYQAGDTINLTLYWLALRSIDRQYKVFVHLRSMDDTQMAAQHDGAPVHGFTPTTRWQPGQVLDDVHPLSLAANLAPGTYQLAVGMYDAETVQNLPVEAEAELAGERVVLGKVTVGQ